MLEESNEAIGSYKSQIVEAKHCKVLVAVALAREGLRLLMVTSLKYSNPSNLLTFLLSFWIVDLMMNCHVQRSHLERTVADAAMCYCQYSYIKVARNSERSFGANRWPLSS